jgi:hypothetical protein
MSNKRIIRHPEQKKRETSFSLGQSLNEMVIPRYDALYDPFLKTFFGHPAQRRLLKVTGAVPAKKRFSLAHFRQRLNADKEGAISPRSSKKKAKSETHDGSSFAKQVALVQVGETLTEEGQAKTSSGTRYKKFYRSQQLPF